MGFFSWKTSDTNKSISNAYSKRGALPVYVLCPDGTTIYEDEYEGYGVFGGYDIFDLVAEWNKNSATIDNLKKPSRKDYGNGEDGDVYYRNAMIRFERDCKMLLDFKFDMSNEYMVDTYGKDWKRIIGINIACYDNQNKALAYPIKFVENPNLDYDSVKPSNGCPNQGYFF